MAPAARWRGCRWASSRSSRSRAGRGRWSWSRPWRPAAFARSMSPCRSVVSQPMWCRPSPWASRVSLRAWSPSTGSSSSSSTSPILALLISGGPLGRLAVQLALEVDGERPVLVVELEGPEAQGLHLGYGLFDVLHHHAHVVQPPGRERWFLFGHCDPLLSVDRRLAHYIQTRPKVTRRFRA